MNPLMRKLSPKATHMIRMDHSHVLTAFHQYDEDASPQQRKALANTVCLALEVHAQLEEEIFYPALRALDPDGAALAKSVPEHDEMKRLIARLQTLGAEDPEHDRVFYELMRDVLHHVADEETVLLPQAELVLADRLEELGAQMTRRRMQLTVPRAGEMARNTVRAMPASTMLLTAGAVLAGTYVVKRAFERRA